MSLPRCEHDAGNSYWNGCEAPARFRVERPGEGYSPAEVCPAHVADMMAYMVDGDDVPLTVHVHFDEPGDVARDAEFGTFLGGYEAVYDDEVDLARVRASYEEWRAR